MESCKIYVDVDATFTKDGRLLPKSFIWTDGHRYEIQRIKHVCRAASLKAGGVLFVNLFDADLFNLFGSINLHFSQISQ